MQPSGGLTRGGLLARNAVWNVSGLALPLLVALLSIPFLIRGFGTERFGILSLAWLLIAYFNVFDLGVARGLTRVVAARLGHSAQAQIGPLAWTALTLLLLFGAASGAALAALAPWLVRDALSISPEYQDESLRAFRVVAWSFPLDLVILGLRGILEAYQRFDIVARLRAPQGILNSAIPLCVLPFSTDLGIVMLAILLGRLALGALHGWACWRVAKGLGRFRWDAGALQPLLAFGIWASVSNLLSPLLFYVDRFFIASLLHASAVAYYATPFEIGTRLSIVSFGVVAVLFPAFSQTVQLDPARAARLFGRGAKYILLIMFPITLTGIAYAGELLTLWVGAEFASRSAPVMRWLLVGVLFGNVNRVAFALIHGANRPAAPALMHLAEAPLYLAGLWAIIQWRGIEGAAMAWTIRVALVDTLVLFVMAARFVPGAGREARHATLGLLAAAAFSAAGAAIEAPALKLAYVGITLVAFVVLTWRCGLDAEEKSHLLPARAKPAP